MAATNRETRQVFVSYAHIDKDRVLPIYDWLAGEGFNMWIDCHRLLGGQDWSFEIQREIERSDVVIVFLSENSVDHRGYFQREVGKAIAKLDELPEGHIYLIPAVLDDNIAIPQRLKQLHALFASDPQFSHQIASAIRYELGRLGVELEKVQREAGISWIRRRLQETWDGFPGYDVQLDVLEFESTTYPNVSEIGQFLKGQFLPALFSHRRNRIEQTPAFFEDVSAEERFRRTDTYDARCDELVVKGKVLSIPFSISWYGAGAAHSNLHFQTYSFLLDPPTLIDIANVFGNSSEALSVLQTDIRVQLTREVQLAEGEWVTLDQFWIEEGTKDWDELSSFVVRPDGLEFLFAPYQVGPYAFGAHRVRVGYERIAAFMRPEICEALELGEIPGSESTT